MKLYSEAFWTFKPNFVNSILIISSYTVSKLVRFWGQCMWLFITKTA